MSPQRRTRSQSFWKRPSAQGIPPQRRALFRALPAFGGISAQKRPSETADAVFRRPLPWIWA
ncbi:hypothetical protein [Kingella potus]|uniref:hypothetical protein n=1 Tax=Kingella potus TaxID=265175 RepID=UPI001FD40BAF|nr:hypothetical protein [Kingella potus]UOP01452.1 hypothetical protein LVJ84_04400 [Kingella potus]